MSSLDHQRIRMFLTIHASTLPERITSVKNALYTWNEIITAARSDTHLYSVGFDSSFIFSSFSAATSSVSGPSGSFSFSPG